LCSLEPIVGDDKDAPSEITTNAVVRLATAFYSAVLNEASITASQTRAEAARGLLHNLRNLIAPALAAPDGARDEFEAWLGNPNEQYIRGWEETRWWQQHINDEAAERLLSFREELLYHVDRIRRKLYERVAATMVTRTLDAYYWYLSRNAFPIYKREPLSFVIAETATAVWETWSTPRSWLPRDDHGRKVAAEHWNRRKEELTKIRQEAGRRRPWAEDKPRLGEWRVIPDRVTFLWNCETDNHTAYPSIAFHILYELLWNGIKYLTSEVVLFEHSEQNPMLIQLDAKQFGQDLTVTYSQPCFGDTGPELVKVLNRSTRQDTGRLPEMSGLTGLRSMVDRCAWQLLATADADQLVVKLTFSNGFTGD